MEIEIQINIISKLMYKYSLLIGRSDTNDISKLATKWKLQILWV